MALPLPALRFAHLPWRAPRREGGEIRLSSRRLYILPTRDGLLFALLLGALLLGAMNYSLSLAYLFTFLLAGIGVAGLIQTHRNLNGLRLHAGHVAPVFAGQSAHFVLHLDNPTGLGRYRIAIEHAQAAPAHADLPAHGRADLSLSLPQPRRGLHRPGRFALSTTYPLGLFRCWTVLELDWTVLVYPRPAADSLPFPAGAEGDQTGRTSRPGDEEFDGLREYRPGDSLKRIAWKTLAREQPLATKQFAAPVSRGLWFDWTQTPGGNTEAKLSRLTRWLLDAEATGLDYGLRLPARSFGPARGEAHLRACLEALARFGEA
ncbi:uncharacterized protein DUF58 [Sulfuritortus calidifontis]|uniref:Uncharacterized protein DUF58 n=1 Tax=Sulfuritortus calidifontis TaxID=1914471 RepID=A0A4V2UQW6_9PROT|nr:DUF58 domain-containing protein [Sulfuritortus calidifontis]TCS72997.1 uncharacterized protein DUF58 [Sulfuritortus calidifontis]